MNNSWYFTQELAAAHQRDLRELRGHSPQRRTRKIPLIPLHRIVARFHRTAEPTPAPQAWQ